ncbi:MAG: flagellar brake protein [Phycisphaerales bacterium]|nr:flagellar brake protein [Phycisphaerales bacterium]
MPAHRSRTENWRQCLEQIAERTGAIELAVRTLGAAGGAGGGPGGNAQSNGPDIVWRVKLLDVGARELLVTSPAAAGQRVELAPQQMLTASYVIGQNRWAFATTVLGDRPAPARSMDGVAIALSLPTSVNRCPRRSSERLAISGFNLPEVECWPVLDPTTIAAAESANRAMLTRVWTKPDAPCASGDRAIEHVMPEVGPRVTARLVNISGGGVGLSMTPESHSAIDRHAFTFVRMRLAPHVPAPLCMTVRRAHSKLESDGLIHVGCALDYTWSPEGQRFIAELFARYMTCIQGKGRRLVEAA